VGLAPTTRPLSTFPAIFLLTLASTAEPLEAASSSLVLQLLSPVAAILLLPEMVAMAVTLPLPLLAMVAAPVVVGTEETEYALIGLNAAPSTVGVAPAQLTAVVGTPLPPATPPLPLPPLLLVVLVVVETEETEGVLTLLNAALNMVGVEQARPTVLGALLLVLPPNKGHVVVGPEAMEDALTPPSAVLSMVGVVQARTTAPLEVSLMTLATPTALTIHSGPPTQPLLLPL
jgi:hypothetical protein